MVFLCEPMCTLQTTGFVALIESATMIVQIYEIQSCAEARTMIDLDVDHVGSVLISSSQGQDPQLKKTIKTVQSAGRKSSLIPLFTQVDLIAQAIEYYRPDMIHFCETLPANADDGAGIEAVVSRQHAIRKRFAGLEIMRSIPIGQDGHPHLVPSLTLAKAFEPISHWFLTDTLLACDARTMEANQPVSGYVGITGMTCDWEIARQLVQQSAIPVILAGGIGPHNVAAAIAQTNPAGVDSCTQTNLLDAQGRAIRFQKDAEKVRALVERAKNNGFEFIT
jgi:phosphoribosylanthranilate isomerase